MTIRNSWKKLIAGTLAALVVAGTVPANTDFGGFFGGTSITASAKQQETLLTTITGAGSNAYQATSANVSYSTDGVATLTFSQPTQDGQVSYQSTPAWGWWGYDITLTVTPAEGYTITKCVFYDDKDRTATDSEAPFVVETTAEDKTPKVNGTPILEYTSKGITKIEVYGYQTPSGPDKTDLNTAITAAETLYNSIKDNTDYADIASTLQTAINNAKAVADSNEADQDTVDTAATNITNAKTTAETAKKNVDDTKAANAVIEMINDLPASTDISASDKTDIEAARAAYNALTDDQKTKVSPEILQKLQDAEAAAEKDEADQAAAGTVTSTINDLPAAEDITTADKADIEAARKAYDDLTDDQKAKVTPETLQKLQDAEAALAAAEKEAADQAAADAVTSTINDLPAAEDITTADKADIEAARKAYDDLTDDQKAKVTPETLQKLQDAEAALAAAEKDAADKAAAGTVEEKLNNLPDPENVETTDKEIIEAARAAYDELTDDQKAKVSEEALKKLTDAEEALAAAEKEAADQAAADDVTALIEKLPSAEDVTTADKAAIEEVRKNYDALTEDQKAKVSDETLKKLTDAEEALAAAEKEAADQAAADDVTALVEKLPAAKDVKTADKAAIEAARKAYDALTEDQKAKVSADTLKKLTDAEAALAEAGKKTSDDSSKSDSSKTDGSSNSGASNASTSNPATGAAAGMGSVALAAAALIVAKKKKDE